MKNPVPEILCVLALSLASLTAAEDFKIPRKISIAPANDLSAVQAAFGGLRGFGSAACGGPMSEAYRSGDAIATRNAHFGQRNILVIDDGKTDFPATDKETGLPITILTDAKITEELRDAVRGYNSAMRLDFKYRAAKSRDALKS